MQFGVFWFSDRMGMMQFANGELIRSTSASPVYIVLQGKRRHIPDPDTFEYLGFLPADVHEVENSLVQGIPEGPQLPSLAARRNQEKKERRQKEVSDEPFVYARPHTIPRWLALSMIGTLAVIGIILVILIPDHLVNAIGLRPVERSQEISQTRGTLAQLLTGIAILLGLYFTLQSVQVSRATLLATVENQLSERYAKSLDLVRISNTPEVRLGGILALERIALTSSTDRATIFEFFAILLRANVPLNSQTQRSAVEVEGILSALSRISEVLSGNVVLNLRGVHINDVHTTGVRIGSADFTAAHIHHCTMMHSKLTQARFTSATVSDVDLRFSNMEKLIARGAIIINSDLSWSDLVGSVFLGADLRGTSFVGSRLAGVIMIGADLRCANLRSTDLRFVDLTDAVLEGAKADADTRWPAGFDPKLERVSFGN